MSRKLRFDEAWDVATGRNLCQEAVDLALLEEACAGPVVETFREYVQRMPAHQVHLTRVEAAGPMWFVLGSLFTPGEGGTMALWWRSKEDDEPTNATWLQARQRLSPWVHIEFQGVPTEGDLAAVPTLPEGFLTGRGRGRI